MWFKNLTIFRFSEPFAPSLEALAGQLAHYAFQPCASYQPSAAGWTPPLGRRASDLVHGVAGRLLVCLRTEEKLLPASVVNQMLADRIAALEDQQRPVRRREKQELRERLIEELLPRALTRGRHSYAYFDFAGDWLVIDSATARGVEEVTALLRTTLGTLPIRPPKVKQSPSAVMTAWLLEGRAPPEFAFGDSCELREPGEAGGVVRCRGQDLTGDELRGHVLAGKQVTRLSLVWQGRVAFILDEDLVVRRLQFLDVVREALDGSYTDSPEAIFDAEYALMTGELALLLPRLLELFGSEEGC
ncbi:MAG: recombination-associated protein RdgC [Nitrosomonas ureae]